MKPDELYALSVEEYNYFMKGIEIRQKEIAANAIISGYYTAYYVNSGKKARKPKELVAEIYQDKKMSYNDGVKELERLQKIEF